MRDEFTLSREQAGEIFKAINCINGILKAMPKRPENKAWMYAVMSNLAVIQTHLASSPRVTSN